jgi:hypothetical protein
MVRALGGHGTHKRISQVVLKLAQACMKVQ